MPWFLLCSLYFLSGKGEKFSQHGKQMRNSGKYIAKELHILLFRKVSLYTTVLWIRGLNWCGCFVVQVSLHRKIPKISTKPCNHQNIVQLEHSFRLIVCLVETKLQSDCWGLDEAVVEGRWPRVARNSVSDLYSRADWKAHQVWQVKGSLGTFGFTWKNVGLKNTPYIVMGENTDIWHHPQRLCGTGGGCAGVQGTWGGCQHLP